MSIGIGILGFAHGHVGVYCDQWLKMPDSPIRLIAAWDHDEARAIAARDKYNIELCDRPVALCARQDIDAVVIGAETSLHAHAVEKAALTGKKIILQKPLALTMEQADRIVETVEHNRVPFTLAWQMRVDPQNLEMKRLLQSGEFGRVFMVRRRHGLSAHVWPGFENTWHVRPELNRGMWADDAAHAIDFLLWLLGKPESVTAEIETLRSEKVPDDNGIAIFRYPDGTLAEVGCSFTCLAGENTTEIVCENGVIIQNYGDGPSTQMNRPAGAPGLKWMLKGQKDWTISPIPSPQSHGERIAALAPELAKFLLGQRESICSADEARLSLRMTLACYESAHCGHRVAI